MNRYHRYATIGVGRAGRILTLTLNQPEHLNGTDGVMHEELSSIFHVINADADVML